VESKGERRRRKIRRNHQVMRGCGFERVTRGVKRVGFVGRSYGCAICQNCHFRGDRTPPLSSGGSRNDQTYSNTTTSPISVAAHNILSLAKL